MDSLIIKTPTRATATTATKPTVTATAAMSSATTVPTAMPSTVPTVRVNHIYKLAPTVLLVPTTAT